MSEYFIPVGTRCASAEVSQLIVNQPRLPFDWTQMNVWTMKKVIELEKNSVRSFWEYYLSDLDETKHNRTTQSWFPHDSFSDDVEKNATIDKYTRRTNRLISVLESPVKKIFFIMFGFPEIISYEIVNILYDALKRRTNNNCYFIVCNALISPDMDIDDMYLFYEKLENESGNDDANWKELVKKAHSKVVEILEKKKFYIKPFHQ